MADERLEDLVVGIRADLDHFKKDMKGVTDEVKASNSSMASDVKSFSAGAVASYGKIAAVAGFVTVAIAGITSAIGEFISAANEAVAAERVLESQLKATGHAAGLTVVEIQALAKARHQITAFEDDTTTAAASILTSFTNIREEAFKRTIVSAQDLSTVMGGQLSSTVLQLGKALNNPAEGLAALTRAGVQFSEGEKEVIKWLAETNRLAEAQELILQGLEGKYGGAAEAAVTPSQQMGLVLGDLAEMLGMLLLPALNELFTGIRDLINELVPGEDAVASLGVALKILLLPVSLLFGTLQLFAKLVNETVGLMMDLVDWINQAIPPTELWGETIEWVKGLFVGLLRIISKIPGSIGDMADAAIEEIEASEQAAEAAEAERQSLAELEAQMKLTKAAEKEMKEEKEQAQKISELISQREIEVATMEMAAHSAEIYKLRLVGLSDVQAEQLDYLGRLKTHVESTMKVKKENEEQIKRETEAYKTYNKQLIETATLFGLEGRDREIAKREMEGLSKERIKELKGLDAEIDALEGLEKRMGFYKETMTGLMTPQQKFNQEVTKLTEIRHLLGESNFDNAIKELRKQLEDPFVIDLRVQGVDAVEAGSADALARISAFRSAIAKPNESLELPASVGASAPVGQWKEKFLEKTGGPNIDEINKSSEKMDMMLAGINDGISELVKIEQNKEADTETVNLDGG